MDVCFRTFCQMEGVATVDIVREDFRGHFCQTGSDCQLSVAAHAHDFPSKNLLRYYVQSVPFVTYPQKESRPGKVPSDAYLIVEFQKACDEWSKFTCIYFKRTEDKENADFRIRIANGNEEEEKKNLIADSFFWSYPKTDLKVLRLWKQLGDWDAYSVFLHEVGHILGFRHEHAFLSEDERSSIGSNESSIGYLMLQTVVDKSSIMSYGYLHQFKENSGRAELSRTDQLQANRLYDKLHSEKRFEIVHIGIISHLSFLMILY